LQKKIIQVSDIHFGEKTFSSNLKNNLIKQIANENPDMIIISGDLTTQGYLTEYNDASSFLDDLNP
jgi:Icc protein